MTSSRTRTAYAERLSDTEVAERTKDMSLEDREEFRIENAVNPLFDMWLRFEAAFGDRAIDRLDVTDEDAEAAARRMEVTKTASGAAFAYLLRSIADRRRMRVIHHKVSAIWESSGTREGLSFPEINERYEKLPKGEWYFDRGVFPQGFPDGRMYRFRIESGSGIAGRGGAWNVRRLPDGEPLGPKVTTRAQLRRQILESMAEGTKPEPKPGHEVYARWHTYGITSSVQWFQRRTRRRDV